MDRRSFLLGSASVAAAAAVPTLKIVGSDQLSNPWLMNVPDYHSFETYLDMLLSNTAKFYHVPYEELTRDWML